MPEARLYAPDELWFQQHGPLVSAFRPMLAFDTDSPGSMNLASDLGVLNDVPVPLVADQLESLLGSWESARNDAERATRFAPAFRAVYQFLGSTPSPLALLLRHRFANRRCLHHGEKLWDPADVFLSNVSHFGDDKLAWNPGDPTIRTAFIRLGAKEKPELRDYVEYVNSVCQQQAGKPLAKSERKRFLALFGALARLASRPVERFPLLTNDYRLLPAEQVFEADDPRYNDLVRSDEIGLAHASIPSLFRKQEWFRSLSRDLIVRPREPFEPDDDPDRQREAARLRAQIRSRQFLRGFARLIYHDHGVRRFDDLEWTQRVDVKFVREIDSELSVEVNHRKRVVGSGASRCHYDEARGCLFVASTIHLAADHIATAFNRTMEDGRRLTNRSDLVAILKCPPTEIRATLDDLGVRQLPREDIDIDLEADVDAETVVRVDEAPAGVAIETPVVRNEQQTNPTQVPTQPARERPARQRSDAGVRKRSNPNGPTASHNDDGANKRDRGAVTSAGKTEARMSPDRRRRRKARPRDRAVTYVVGPLRPDGSIEPSCLSDEERGREKALGDAAVELVCEFERQRGRLPDVQTHNNPGFDVESRTPDDPSATRTIEVKGIRGRWTALGVKLSPTQFEIARALGDRFWLYVVEYADEPDRATVHPVRNPFAKVTEYRFDHGWRQLADPRDAPSRRHAIGKGDELEVRGRGIGTVLAAIDRGAMLVLKIALAGGEVLNRPYNPATMRILARSGG